MAGKRAPFEAWVLTDSKQENYLLHRDQIIRDQEEDVDRQEQEQRQRQMQQLNKTQEQYSVDNFRNELADDIEETKEEVRYTGQSQRKEIQEILDLMEQMRAHHENSLHQVSGDIIEQSFIEYGESLDELELKDINSLKKRVGELKGMQKNLARDL